MRTRRRASGLLANQRDSSRESSCSSPGDQPVRGASGLARRLMACSLRGWRRAPLGEDCAGDRAELAERDEVQLPAVCLTQFVKFGVCRLSHGFLPSLCASNKCSRHVLPTTCSVPCSRPASVQMGAIQWWLGCQLSWLLPSCAARAASASCSSSVSASSSANQLSKMLNTSATWLSIHR